MDIDVSAPDETAPDYEIADNFAENLVDAVRSDIVGNEEVYLITNFTYATGLFPNPQHYNAQIITGSSSEGKSAVKKLVDRRWPINWLLRMTDTSEKGSIDDTRFNDRYVFAGDELNKLPSQTREILKSTYGDDSDEEGWGYIYVRNTSQEDGADHEEKKKQTMPFVVLMADENESGARDWELRTRMVETKVESDEGINEAVSATMWDHDHVTVPDREYEYEFNFEDGKQAIDYHISKIPRVAYRREGVPEGWATNQKYAYPVIIPNDDSKQWPIDGGDRTASWDAHTVVKPILPFKESDSKRSSKMLANIVRASALLNYHNRETVDVNGLTHYIAEPQDVGNLISVRATLLATTHNLDDKRLAVIEALTDEHNGVGGVGPLGGLQSPKKDIAEYINEYADISSITDNHLTAILDDMADRFLLTVHEGDGPNGAHMYEYHGGSAFGHPRFDRYPDAFRDVTDPIRMQPIEETVRMHKQMLQSTSVDGAASLVSDEASEAPESSRSTDSTEQEGSLSSFSDEDDGSDVEWTEVDRRVAQALREVLDDKRATDEDIASMSLSHMVGASPSEVYEGDNGQPHVRAERPSEDGDKDGTILDPDDPVWGQTSEEQVEAQVEAAVTKLRRHDVFEVFDEPDGEYSDMYFIIHEIDD